MLKNFNNNARYFVNQIKKDRASLKSDRERGGSVQGRARERGVRARNVSKRIAARHENYKWKTLTRTEGAGERERASEREKGRDRERERAREGSRLAAVVGAGERWRSAVCYSLYSLRYSLLCSCTRYSTCLLCACATVCKRDSNIAQQHCTANGIEFINCGSSSSRCFSNVWAAERSHFFFASLSLAHISLSLSHCALLLLLFIVAAASFCFMNHNVFRFVPLLRARLTRPSSSSCSSIWPLRMRWA